MIVTAPTRATGIVGARGFIGSYLSRYVASRTTGKLRLLTRNTEGFEGVITAEVMNGDLMFRSDCERFAGDLELIYYLAHKNSPIDSDLDMPNDALVNLVPLLNLLQTIESLKTVPHLVYFSSGGGIYKRKKKLIPYGETDSCEPSSSYGIQKLAAEQYLRLAADKGYLTATVLRVGNAYGSPHSEFRRQGLIGVATNSVLKGNPVRIFGNPSNVRDYIHLEDISDVAVRAGKFNESFNVFNVGSGVGHSVLDVVRTIGECRGEPVQIVSNPDLGGRLTDWVVLDITKARAAFAWTPTIDLRSGISRMLSERAE